MKIFSLLLMPLIFNICASAERTKEVNTPSTVKIEHTADQTKGPRENAYFASGCFWCVEAIFEHVKGVKEVVSGYSGGNKENPTYRQVANGGTGHAEVVEVQYNPEEVDFKTLVKVFYGSQNPTTVGQYPDFGDAYRSVIFYTNDTEKQIADAYKEEIQKEYTDKVVTEIIPFKKFWRAEEYHQDYERKNPNQRYIVGVSKPRLEKFKAKFPELVR